MLFYTYIIICVRTQAHRTYKSNGFSVYPMQNETQINTFSTKTTLPLFWEKNKNNAFAYQKVTF